MTPERHIGNQDETGGLMENRKLEEEMLFSQSFERDWNDKDIKLIIWWGIMERDNWNKNPFKKSYGNSL